MEVILLQDVEQVGLRGDVVNVARGYMRNFLQPRGLAQPATPALLAELEKREEQRARHEARDGDQAKEIAKRIGATVLRFEVKSGPRGRLFGSVTPTNIVDELWEQEKIRVDRRKLDLPETIKRIGRYTIPVAVFEDVTAEIHAEVVPEGGELPSEQEVAAWEAEERAEEAEAAGEGEGEVEVEVEAEVEAEAEEPSELEVALAEEDAARAEAVQEGDEPTEQEADEAEAASDADAPEATPEEPTDQVEAAWAQHEETLDAEAEAPAESPAEGDDERV
jgi:large subunit ribosomal protein L9